MDRPYHLLSVIATRNVVRYDNICNSSPMTQIQRAVEALLKQHGSYRAAALASGIDHAYLHNLRMGLKTDPSAAVLAKLGIAKRVRYVRINRSNA